MCGRFSLIADPEEVMKYLGLDDFEPFPPRYNIAPTQPIMMVVNGPGGKRQSLLARWGLMPSWVKDPADFSLLINARSETAAQKPSFRNAMRHRRALIPASGFYEWHRPSDKTQTKQAYWIKPSNSYKDQFTQDNIVCFGALLETWIGENGSEIDTGCILTKQANGKIGNIHHRMPVIIKPQDFDRWLDCTNYEPRNVDDLMQCDDDELFEAIAISDKINKVSNVDADVQLPQTPGIGHNSNPNNEDKPSKKGKKASRFDDAQISLF